MFRPSLISWIALSAALLVLGLALGNAVLLTGAVFILLSALLATAPSSPSGIVIERSLPRATCWAGDTLTVARRLTIQSGIGPVFVYDTLPPESRIVGGNNLRVVWKWPGKKTFDIPYDIQFPRRGLFVLERSGWESRAPFGVKRGASGFGGERFEVSVAPRMRSVTRLNEVRAATKNPRLLGDIAMTGASTTEFRELRPYQPGDPIKRINWKASSRGSRGDNLPFVNEPEPEARKAVWIFLDMATYMDVGVPLSSPLENTIEASGTLAQYYLSKSCTLGAYAYNTSSNTGELLSPEAGGKQFGRLMRMLTGLKPGHHQEGLIRAVEWCKDFLFQLRPEVFIITRLDVHYSRPGESTESLERFIAGVNRLIFLRARSRRRGRVCVVHVGPREPARGTQTPVLTRWETRVVAGMLRQSGASVVEWEPAQEEFTSVLVRQMSAFR